MGIGIEEGGVYVSNNVWIAFVFFFATIYLWGQSIIGATDWRETRNPVGPTLRAEMSPFDRMYNGVTGCLAAVILRFCSLLCFGIGFFILLYGYEPLLVVLYVLIGVYTP